MAPFPIVFALKNTRIHIHSSNCYNMITNIETSVNKMLGIYTTMSFRCQFILLSCQSQEMS